MRIKSPAGASPETADSRSATPPPKVLYVLGAGRSGSTILGVALGNFEGVFFVKPDGTTTTTRAPHRRAA